MTRLRMPEGGYRTLVRPHGRAPHLERRSRARGAAGGAFATLLLLGGPSAADPAAPVQASAGPVPGDQTPSTQLPSKEPETGAAGPTVVPVPDETPKGDVPAPRDPEAAPPPPTNVAYLQYGVAFTAEVPTAAGPICSNVGIPCILGPGGGVAVRVGYRSTGAFYVGGAYELTKQDANNLYRFATLQQARVEARYYMATARQAYPYVSAAAGVAGYGNEWGVDTYGPGASLGGGVELQVTRRTVVGIGIAYRGLYLSSFVDTSGAARSAGVTQLVGLDIILEQRDPLGQASRRDAKAR